MALNADQELREHELRVEQMTTNIEQMHANIDRMRFDIDHANRQLRRQTYGIFFQVVGLVVGAFAAGAAWAHYFHS